MMNRRSIKKYWSWAYAVVILYFVVYAVYIAVNGENVYMQIHDNLDSNIAWLKMMQDHHLFWTKGTVLPFLSGLDRNYMYSDLKVYSWLYMLLPAFYAFIAGDMLRTAIAVAGALCLGKTLLGERLEHYKDIIILCGFAYGILPVFPTAGIDFAALPLFFAALIRLYRTGEKKYFFFLFFVSFFVSSFAGFGIFICGYLVLFFLIDWIANRRPKWRMLAALGVASASYLVTDARLIYMMLLSPVKSMRGSIIYSEMSLLDVARESILIFIRGQYHAEALQKYLVLPVCGIFFLILNIRYVTAGTARKIPGDPYNWLMVWLGFNAVVYGLDSYAGFKQLVAVLAPPLRGFSFARTMWFSPFVWYFAFAMALCRLYDLISPDLLKKWIVYGLCFLSVAVTLIVPVTYNHIQMNIENAARNLLNHDSVTELTYREFYSEALFDHIKEDIGYQGEYSAAYGMHPAVIEYNGIATLDGYCSTYSQEYKDQFRKLIAPELAVDPENRSYFDDWGGRAYLFMAPDPEGKRPNDEADLLIDPDVFGEMGGRYIFSRVRITNAEELQFDLKGVYSDEDSPYTIYVYGRR